MFGIATSGVKIAICQCPVYDFVHLQRAVFDYTGVALVTSAIANVSVSMGAYEGVVDGFRGKTSVADYGGFSVTRGGGISTPDIFGVTAGIGVAYFESTTEQLIGTGIRGVSAGVSASGAFGLQSLSISSPVDTYTAVTYYELRGRIYNFLDPFTRNRDEAAHRMVDEMGRYPIGYVSSDTLVDLWGSSWNTSRSTYMVRGR